MNIDRKKTFKILANKIQQCILAMNMGTPKLKNTIPFTTEHMKKEYLGENLIIHTQDLHDPSYKTLMKEIKELLNKQTRCVPEL